MFTGGSGLTTLRMEHASIVDWVTDSIAVSEYPSSTTDLEQFHAVINLDRFTPYHTNARHVHAPLIDGPGNTAEDVAALLKVTEERVHQGKVLVHCAAGVSRSPFIIALYLAWTESMPFEDAIGLVASRRRRPLNIDPGLLQIKDQVLGLMVRRA